MNFLVKVYSCFMVAGFERKEKRLRFPVALHNLEEITVIPLSIHTGVRADMKEQLASGICQLLNGQEYISLPDEIM